MAKQIDTLSEIGSDLCDSLGFNPISNSTKPLYVANALFRACTGIECDVEDIHEWILSEHKSKATSSAEILRKYDDVIYTSGMDVVEDLKEARYFLEKVFNPDSTVHPSTHHSVMNISSKWLVRSYLPEEAKIGEFIHNILCTPLDGKCSQAIRVIESALLDDDDDLTRIIKPLIVRKPEAERIQKKEPEHKDIAWNETTLAIRRGFDRLAQNCEIYSRTNGRNSLLVLRRMVTYAIFAAFYYLEDINQVAFGGEKIPLLLDANQRLGAIERASELCFIACKKSVENYTVSFIYNWLEEAGVIENINSQTSCECYIKAGFVAEEKVRTDVLQHINAHCKSGNSPLLATAKALQFALYTHKYKNTTPSDFCTVLGGKSGFVGPNGNAAKYKRFLINSFLLETIVLSVVDTDDLLDGIELRDLGNALRETYGILIGADSHTDYAMLDCCGIAGTTPEDLRGELSENSRAIADMLISLGLAKRYADGVTLIGWGL